jgi:hypothetical protein
MTTELQKRFHRPNRSLLLMAVCLLAATAFSSASYADLAGTDITQNLTITKTRMIYNPRTQTSSTTVSIYNPADTTITGNFRVFIANISRTDVTLSTTTDGTEAEIPYFAYDSGLAVNETLTKALTFDNPNRSSFTFEVWVITPPSGDSSGEGEDGSGEDPGGDSGDDESSTKSGVYSQDGTEVAEYSESGTSTAPVAYASETSDESAVYVYNGGSYTLTTAELSKTGDSSAVNTSDFTGLNAIVLSDYSEINLTHCSLYSNAEGANGAFAYNEGAVITLKNCEINTEGNSSRGVDATYGGQVYIYDSTISTLGDHCAALASDRYEDNDPPEIHAQNVVADTAGEGSPGIYCTGTFVIDSCTTTATGSEAAAIEGLNSITLTDSDISGAVKWGVIIYQSMSGDSTVGTGTFDMTGGTFTNDSDGPDFMVCNTSAVINLTDVEIMSSEDSDVLIRATDSSSGDANINSDWGSQGGDVTFTASAQTLEGTVSCNALSAISMSLSDGSTLSGAVLIEDGGEVNLSLDSGSTWTATADSTVTALTGVESSGDQAINVDAKEGVTITCTSINGNTGVSYALASGGTLTAP